MLIEKTITSGGKFTDWLYITGGNYIDLSISNLGDSIVSFQRVFNKKNGDILDIQSFEENIETSFFAASSAYYRLGVKKNDYNGEKIKLKLKNGRL